MKERILLWDGCNNVRDLGGLKTSDGRKTRFGKIIRGDSPGRLSEAGWKALHDYGVRTIITLRTLGMVEPDLDFTSPYPDIAVVQAPIEDINDQEFLQKWVVTDLWGTPLYFGDVLKRWPEKHAAVITAIARAQPGGALFHCIRGYDRTGIISFLLLALAGVTSEEIQADYELSVEPARERILARHNSTVREAIRGTLEGINIEEWLLKGGASRGDLEEIRKKLLTQAGQ